MKQFEIYTSPIGEIQVVKDGFSWPGFFFSWIWAFIAKLWIPASIMMVVSFALAPFYASVIVTFFSGFWGNDWRRSNLLERGFKLTSTVEASSGEHARYLLAEQSNQNTQPSSDPPEIVNHDATQKLKDLKDLLDKGVITQEEYESKKAPLLEEL